MEDANLQPSEKSQPRFMIGTSGWTYEHWKGCFYPPDLPKSRWFEHYASQFHTVEINATFYRSFSDETYKKWKARAPQGFGYVLKAPQLITHRKYLLDVDADIAAFHRSCALLEDRFEMILLQVAPNMPIDPGRLQKALQAFPDPSKVAVEFRRPEWFTPETLSMLCEPVLPCATPIPPITGSPITSLPSAPTCACTAGSNGMPANTPKLSSMKSLWWPGRWQTRAHQRYIFSSTMTMKASHRKMPAPCSRCLE
jgi:hypothetical protein